jgi:hypothetical protein
MDERRMMNISPITKWVIVGTLFAVLFFSGCSWVDFSEATTPDAVTATPPYPESETNLTALRTSTPVADITKNDGANIEPTKILSDAVVSTEEAETLSQDLNTITNDSSNAEESTARITNTLNAFDSLPIYDLEVDLDYYAHRISVQEKVTIINNSLSPWSEVVFHISPVYWSDIFFLSNVDVLLDEVWIPAEEFLENTMLYVPLPRFLMIDETVEIRIVYELNLPRLDPFGWGPTGNAGWGLNVTQVGDWYPSLVPYDPELGWITWEYKPVGDPVISALADFNVSIVAAPEIIIAAPGWVGFEFGSHKYQLKKARAFAFLASPNYVRLDGMADAVPVTVYVSDAHQESGLVVLDTAIRSIIYFSEIFGDYPYEELVIAENGFLTSMEYSALISLSEFAYDTYGGSPDSLLVSITAHEVAHQWWYGSVGNDQVREPWLDEALAMFSEVLFYEKYYPNFVNWWWQFRVERWQPTGYVDNSIYLYVDSPTFVHDVYSQSAYFMRDLRAFMGYEAFMLFLQEYYVENKYQFVDKNDFFEIAQRHTSQDLSQLTSRYFSQPWAPDP